MSCIKLLEVERKANKCLILVENNILKVIMKGGKQGQLN